MADDAPPPSNENVSDEDFGFFSKRQSLSKLENYVPPPRPVTALPPSPEPVKAPPSVLDNIQAAHEARNAVPVFAYPSDSTALSQTRAESAPQLVTHSAPPPSSAFEPPAFQMQPASTATVEIPSFFQTAKIVASTPLPNDGPKSFSAMFGTKVPPVHLPPVTEVEKVLAIDPISSLAGVPQPLNAPIVSDIAATPITPPSFSTAPAFTPALASQTIGPSSSTSAREHMANPPSFNSQFSAQSESIHPSASASVDASAIPPLEPASSVSAEVPLSNESESIVSEGVAFVEAELIRFSQELQACINALQTALSTLPFIQTADKLHGIDQINRAVLTSRADYPDLEGNDAMHEILCKLADNVDDIEARGRIVQAAEAFLWKKKKRSLVG